jgi:hypothetical protein
MSVPVSRGCVVSALVVAMLSLTTAPPLLAAAPSTLTGRVLADNGADPRVGVVVALVGTDAKMVYRSQPTDERGGFRVDAPAAGSYSVLVEAPEGAFLASNGLQLAPGMNRPVSLALKPGREEGAPAGTPPARSRNKGALPTWAKWVIAGGIVVGAAVIVDAVTKQDKEASSFSN